MQYPLTDNSPMPFGKYKGQAMANIPAATLLWYYENLTNWLPYQIPVKQYIEANLDVIKRQVALTKKIKKNS